MSATGAKHTVVIGAGIVGACCALELVRSGHEVTIVEVGTPGERHAASYGHGCWISPASVVPLSTPGLWKQIPGYLLDPNGPIVIRWRHFGTLLPWLVRFVWAGASVSRVERTAIALSRLLHDSPARHLALAAELAVPDLIRQEGLLYAYPDREAFEVEALSWRLREMIGLRLRELDREALAQREPSLAEKYTFGILVEDGAHCVDPGAYVAKIVSTAVGRGARIFCAKATGFTFEGTRLLGVGTNNGLVKCDRAVVAAGAWSKALAKAAGDKIPLESERGYHGVVSTTGGGPNHPVMPSDGKMANTPTRFGLRLSGQVELSSINAPPKWDRVDILLNHASRTYPALAALQTVAVDKWMGHRPSTPDGLPVIGSSSRSPDVFYAFGHGHIGFASSPVTGCIAAAQLSGQCVDIRAFAPTRFKLTGHKS
ncbi:D-amino-acid dehydrogenase [Mesorhizobium plurifarium]|uniref:D-amino-acid dehydrogenase n=1 Tax=Mesorhizobium plurifarium TaxID=69974 RepID=A0A090DDI4_MESPL|nr:D-amino-acid dehydrogenase [Mesorhizobium plurifarium]